MNETVKDRRGIFHNIGTVLKKEIFGGFEQLVIDFGEEGIQRLRLDDIEFVKSLSELLYDGNYNLTDFILRYKASRMFNDDLKTGSISRMKLDLLPHQILIADKVIRTKANGFLIADDVGLGKTIEAGLVFRSMISHGRADRILLLCPANLTSQWREQMDERFNEWFDILGAEIHIIDPRRWDYNPRIIASIQTLRLPKHREILLDSTQDWDLVIVDEAHHLTAREYGNEAEDLKKTKNYQLLERLRRRARFFLFLTATPHQGEDDRFALLLRLLDSNYVKTTKDLETLGPKINDLIGRNIKKEVTDFNGNKIFQGHDTVPHNISPADNYSAFMEELKKFVNEGLGILNDINNIHKRTENFVLTSFLKLASSSPEAIKRTLTNRLRNLNEGQAIEKFNDNYDYRFEGEREEIFSSKSKEIFSGESQRIKKLLNDLESVVDSKLKELDLLLEKEGFIEDKEKRLLIFTEYRGTQEAIRNHLERKFGKGNIAIMNGDMDLHQKRKVIKQFQTEFRFLISTEAGGEGLDLHKNCYNMVNYDLPWNPMRLAQRTGRLDRYGQKERVKIHYFVVKGTIDDKIQQYLNEKISRIEKRLRDLRSDNVETLREDILGQVTLSRDAVSRLYLTGDKEAESRLQENIDEAVLSYERQKDVFSQIKGFDIKEFNKIESDYKLGDLENLIRQYLTSQHKKLIKEEDSTFHFEIPEEILAYKIFHGKRFIKTKMKGTFDRNRANVLGVELLGTGNEYIDAILDKMIKREGSGNVMGSKIKVDNNNFLSGKKGLLVSYLITSTPITAGRQSFDGVEFIFYDADDESFYNEDSDIRKILELICEEKNHDQMSLDELPSKDILSKMIQEIDVYVKSKIRDGRIGSLGMNSLAWLHFEGVF